MSTLFIILFLFLLRTFVAVDLDEKYLELLLGIEKIRKPSFSSPRILLYYTRWAIEGSFRKLKYTIGLSNFHAYKPEYIKQEIWAKLIAYNITEILINHTIIMKRETKYEYKVNFSVAAHISKVFLRPTTEKDSIDVMSLLCKELIPVRSERHVDDLSFCSITCTFFLISSCDKTFITKFFDNGCTFVFFALLFIVDTSCVFRFLPTARSVII